MADQAREMSHLGTSRTSGHTALLVLAACAAFSLAACLLLVPLMRRGAPPVALDW
ncbi:hypothetical protein J2S71_000890 [Olsenella profusa DSM 13989]|uniref:hypothetical protein n=1 Tax=Olsenella profusa TaxID=138595 RepID=UPI00278A384E|nr:hypothetical protein [Olsenella profusa]MDP9859194.1 hypothetical protein [Olsenella profusa DSM 13989]